MKLASITPRRLQIWLMAVPIAVSAIYLAFFAAPRYVSESIVSVNLATVQPTVVPGLISMTGTPTPLQFEDTLFLMYYIQSQSMLDAIDTKLQLRKHYEGPKVDVLNRLWDGFSQELYLWYWQQRVLLTFDDQSGALTIDAQAFDRETAYKLQKTIMELSDQWVNSFGWRIARDQIAFAQKLEDDANGRLQQAKTDVAKFQAKYRLLDPVADSVASSTLVASLQATLASQQASLNGMLAYMQPNSGQLQSVQAQIAATQQQLAAEKARATVGSADERLADLALQYSNLLLAETLAYNTYLAADAALQSARIDATRKIKSLAVIESATMPDSAAYPRYFYDMLTVCVVCVLLYTIVRLSIATILEHQD